MIKITTKIATAPPTGLYSPAVPLIVRVFKIITTQNIQPWNCIIGKQQTWSLEVTCNFRLYFKIGRGQVLNRVERTEYSRATITVFYTHEYP